MSDAFWMDLHQAESFDVNARIRSERPQRERIIRKIVLQSRNENEIVKKVERALESRGLYVTYAHARQWTYYYVAMARDEGLIDWDIKYQRQEGESTAHVPGWPGFSATGGKVVLV